MSPTSKIYPKFFLPFLLLTLVITTIGYGADEEDVRTFENRENDSKQSAEKPNVQTLSASKETRSSPRVLLDSQIQAIEAEEFPVKAIKTSKSKRVFMLEDLHNAEPRPGKILLLKNGSDDIAAVRVLKNYPGKFATKVVLKFREIPLSTEVRAIKKLSDKLLERIRKREAQGLDPTITDDELAKEIDPADAELDRGIPQPQRKKKQKKDGEEIKPDSLELKEDDLGENLSDFTHTEEVNLEGNNHILTAELALLSNVDSTNTTTRYTGAGVRYGYNFARRLAFDSPSRQDMLTIEASVFFYKILGFKTSDDEVTVIPILATLRYNLLFSEYVTGFLYAGVIRNNATAKSGLVGNDVSILSTTRPAAGGGLLIRIGPGWSIRADVGLDMFAAGASLRF